MTTLMISCSLFACMVLIACLRMFYISNWFNPKVKLLLGLVPRLWRVWTGHCYQHTGPASGLHTDRAMDYNT